MSAFLRPLLPMLFGILLVLNANGQDPEPCGCLNCPLPIANNSTQQSFLSVTVDGPNDLGECPLQKVCFTINHTWVGDLSVTLTSPSGLNYLLMADLDNNTGGCGNDENNIDVCIVPGDTMALAPNADYVCNGDVITEPCLIGEWNVPCGGVTDPITGALEAPNCTLDDFNVPGDPANGVWIFTVNDICMQDVGVLTDWWLEFECGIISCDDCFAEGGSLNLTEATGCEGSSELQLDLEPDYPGNPPDSTLFGYVFLITQNDTILAVDTLADLSGYPVGIYDVCGLSYDLSEADSLANLPGSTLADVQMDSILCYDLSDTCATVNILPVPPITVIDTILCNEDCYLGPDGTLCCGQDTCFFTVPAANGCDSVIQVNITFLPPIETYIDTTLCLGACFTLDTTDYCSTGNYTQMFTAFNGCDSVVYLDLTVVEADAVVSPPDTISCETPTVVLDGTASLGASFAWYDADGSFLIDTTILEVDTGGCYVFVAQDSLNGLLCVDSVTVCVEDIAFPPADPVIEGNTLGCFSDTLTFTLVPDSSALDFTWTLPAGFTVLDGGDGFDFITFLADVAVEGEICVQASNNCGPGVQTCEPLEIVPVLLEPVVVGADTVCENTLSEYCIDDISTVSGLEWTVTGGTILSGQGTECINVQWAETNGSVCLVSSNPCDTSMQVCVPVTVIPFVEAPDIDGPSLVCEGDTSVYLLTVSPGVTDISWIVPGIADVIAGGNGTDSLVVVWSGGGVANICGTVLNGCSQETACVQVTATAAVTDPDPTGPAAICEGEVVIVCTPSDIAAQDYIWNVPAGITILSGQGTQCIQLQWNTASSGSVCVTTTNACGPSEEACWDIEVIPPPQAGLISGPVQACAGDTSVYVIDGLSGAISYDWNIPSGGTLIAGGDGDTTATVIWNDLATETICVSAEGACGFGAASCLDVEVVVLPSILNISGDDTPCVGDTLLYCVSPVDTLASSFNWIVPANATLIGGQGTACAQVVINTTDPTDICATASNSCGTNVETCLSLNPIPQPLAPDFSGMSQGCVGDTATFTIVSNPGNNDFNWIIPSNATVIDGGGNQDFVTIIWDQTGTVDVCVEGVNACGVSSPNCLSVEVTTIPMLSDVSGADTVCVGQVSTYCIDDDPNVEAYAWAVPVGGTILSGQGTTCIEVQWDSPVSGDVCVNTTGFCFQNVSSCLPVTVYEIPAALTIEGPAAVCEGDTAWYYTSNNTFATAVNWNVPACAQVLQQQGLDSIQIVWPVGCGQVSLCVTGFNLCGAGLESCTDIFVAEIPAPQLDVAGFVCDSTVNLEATNVIGMGSWSVLSGPGTATFVDPNATSTQMTVTEFGLYTVVWEEDNGGCIASAMAGIDFNEPISIGTTLEESCDYVLGEYTVSFTIVGGELPFSVNGTVPGQLAGNTFISNPIPSTVPYSFTISNGICDDLVIEGVVECVCTSDAGTMDQDLLEVCQTDSVYAQPTNLPLLDPDDVLQYILHDVPIGLGTVFAISDTPVFALQAGMNSGQTYYISAVVGNELNGQIDLSDPCLSVAVGTPVVFLTAPFGLITNDGQVCEGDLLEVPMSFSGEGPFNVLIDGDLYINLEATDTIYLDIDQDQWITLAVDEDGNGCTSISSDSVFAQIIEPPEATVAPQVSICNTPDSGMEETLLDFSELILAGDSSGTWIDEDMVGLIPPFYVFDFVFQDTGIYNFTYVTNSALGPCPEQMYPVEVIVEACDCPPVELVAQDSFCRLEGQYDLTNLILNADPGFWSITGTPPGATQLPMLSGNTLDALGSDPGTYILTYTLSTDPAPGCENSTTVEFNIEEEAEAGDPQTMLEYCEGTDKVVLLNDYVNSGAMGAWEDVSLDPVTGAAFDPGSGTFELVNQVAGEYTFQYTVQGVTPCEDDISTVVVILNAPPTVEAAGSVTEISCVNEVVSLGGPGTAVGSNYVYNWQSLDGNPIDEADMLTIEVEQEGLYVLTVTDTVTGCFASDTVEITYSDNWPAVSASGISPSCPEDSDGQITIDTATGGVPPFLFALNGGALTGVDTFTGLTPGIYQVGWEDAQGCTGELEVEVAEKEEVDVIVLADFTEEELLELGDSVAIFIDIQPFTPLFEDILWMPGASLSCDTCLETFAFPLETTEYQVEILVDGCLYETSFKLVVKDVEEIPQPNIFSPDGDGLNDFFTIYGGNEIEEVLSLRVFSRWGELVYQQLDFEPNLSDFGWDGTHRGKPAPVDVYTWVAELLLVTGETLVISGDIALVR